MAEPFASSDTLDENLLFPFPLVHRSDHALGPAGDCGEGA